MMVRREEPGGVFFPRDPGNHDWQFKINNETVTSDVFRSPYSKAVTEEIGSFELELVNSGAYNGVQLGQSVEILFDYKYETTDATTRRFLGKIEKISAKTGTIVFIGRHVSSELMDVLVTESFNGSVSANNIIINLFSTYLAGKGYTTTNVNSSTSFPVINWNEKPLFDCMIDLCRIAGFDFYIDDDRGVHFFEKETIENDIEFLHLEINMDYLSGLEDDQYEVKNKIKVQGTSPSGLPILYTSEDSGSQGSFGIKERLLRDSNINSVDAARSAGNAQLASFKDGIVLGEALARPVMIDLNPGDLIWVVHMPSEIKAQYKVYKFTHDFFSASTKVVLGKQRTTAKLFKDRIKQDMDLDITDNPNKMLYSTKEFEFNDLSDVPNSSNVAVKDSRLYRSSGVTGTAQSSAITLQKVPTSIEFRATGNTLSQILFYYSEDAVTWNLTNLNAEVSVSFNNARIYFKIEINDGSAEVEGLLILYK